MKFFLAVLLGSCLVSPPAQPRPSGARTAAEQVDSTVDIGVLCGEHAQYGSGTVVSKDFVVTALHVVTCDGGESPVVILLTSGGEKHAAVVDLKLTQLDVARLALLVPLKHSDMVAVGPRPVVGDRVCEASAEPRWTYRCFTVTTPKAAEAFGGADQGVGPAFHEEILVDGSVEHGNSGSALYDASGLLVGIVVSGGACEQVTCVGGVAPLQGVSWLAQ